MCSIVNWGCPSGPTVGRLLPPPVAGMPSMLPATVQRKRQHNGISWKHGRLTHFTATTTNRKIERPINYD
jgi:hypothetical protein